MQTPHDKKTKTSNMMADIGSSQLDPACWLQRSSDRPHTHLNAVADLFQPLLAPRLGAVVGQQQCGSLSLGASTREVARFQGKSEA